VQNGEANASSSDMVRTMLRTGKMIKKSIIGAVILAAIVAIIEIYLPLESLSFHWPGF